MPLSEAVRGARWHSRASSRRVYRPFGGRLHPNPGGRVGDHRLETPDSRQI